MPALSIIVPAYNEAARLTDGMGRLGVAVAQGAFDPAATEILVVDDGSTDATAATAESLLQAYPLGRVIRRPRNRGKGAAVRAGVAEATGALTAYMDADMAIDPVQLPSLLSALDQADVAIGSRAVGGRGVVYATARRTLQGRAFNLAVNTVTGVGLPDTQCGFKAFRTPVARLLFGCTVIDRFAFDMELLRTARRFGLRIAEVPVAWNDVPDSHIRPLRDPASMLLDLLTSRTGLRTPPALPALEVAGVDPRSVADALADPTVPLLAWDGTGRPGATRPDASSAGPPVAIRSGTLVLLPLRAGDVLDVAARLTDEFRPSSSVRRVAVPVRQLHQLAPLALVRAGAPGVGTMAGCPVTGTSPPPTDPRP